MKVGKRLINIRLLKSFLLVSFLFFSARAISPNTSYILLPAAKPIDSYDRLVRAIVQVESSGNVLAYNKKENAVGAFQIRRIRLNDYNRKTGKNYKHEDCYDYDISREIFMFYAKRIGYPDYEKIAKRWNGSGKLTLTYWKKVQEHL